MPATKGEDGLEETWGGTRGQGGKHLVHLPDKLVDVFFTVSMVATLHKVFEFACSPSTGGVRELEWPEEVRSLHDKSELRECKTQAKKRRACLKLGPTVKISWTKSSIERISYLPKACSMIELLDNGILCLSTFPYPRL